MPASLQLLRSASLLLFALSATFLLFSITVDFAPHQARVYDANHKIIGTAAIPFNESGLIFFALLFFALSGLQLWTAQAIISSRKSTPAPPYPDRS